MNLVPVSLAQAKEFVTQQHRHNVAPTGWKFGVGVEVDGVLVGVGVAGRPVARGLDDGLTLEVLRVCTDGTANACSMLYGALLRAAKALGYRRVFTYTLVEEPGGSLKAVGWREDALLAPRKNGWDTPSRPADASRTPNGAKRRWIWEEA